MQLICPQNAEIYFSQIVVFCPPSWNFQAIVTTRDRLPDLEMRETDSKFISVADLWAEIYKYLYLGNLHEQAIATAEVRFPDLDIIVIDSLFVFVAKLWAEIYKYLFLRLFWPPSWKVAFASYSH